MCSQNLFKNKVTNKLFAYIYAYIIIMSRHQHRFPWPSLVTLLNRPSLSVGLQGDILYRHRAGHPAFARPCEGVHRSMSLMISSLFFQKCPACLVRQISMVFVMGGEWP